MKNDLTQSNSALNADKNGHDQMHPYRVIAVSSS